MYALHAVCKCYLFLPTQLGRQQQCVKILDQNAYVIVLGNLKIDKCNSHSSCTNACCIWSGHLWSWFVSLKHISGFIRINHQVSRRLYQLRGLQLKYAAYAIPRGLPPKLFAGLCITQGSDAVIEHPVCVKATRTRNHGPTTWTWASGKIHVTSTGELLCFGKQHLAKKIHIISVANHLKTADFGDAQKKTNPKVQLWFLFGYLQERYQFFWPNLT